MGQRLNVAKELGDFLQSRRRRLRPKPGSGNRRTRGLRREEVAEQARVSREYFTKLEQGRALNPSPEVLGAVAKALLLSDDEVTYVQDLAALLWGVSLSESALDPPDEVGSRLVEAIQDRPAFVIDQRLDVTSWNDMACELLTDLDALTCAHRNLSWLLFLDPEVGSRCVEWDDAAKQNVALLRGAAGRHPNDRRIAQLVNELSVKSTSFTRLWASHDVMGRNHGSRVFEHPRAGRFDLHYDALQLPDCPDRHLVIYSAHDCVAERALAVMRSIGRAGRQDEQADAAC